MKLNIFNRSLVEVKVGSEESEKNVTNRITATYSGLGSLTEADVRGGALAQQPAPEVQRMTRLGHLATVEVPYCLPPNY